MHRLACVVDKWHKIVATSRSAVMGGESFAAFARQELTLFVALCLVFFALSLRDEYDEGYELLSRLFFRTASARPPILVVAVLFGWAGVTHALTSRGLRVSRAVGGICEPRVVSRYALGLLDVILACRLVPFVADVVFATDKFGVWCLTFDIVAYGCCFGALVAPPSSLFLSPPEAFSEERSAAHARYDHSAVLMTAHSRAGLFRALVDSLCAPFAPVTFWHVIVADYATSLAKALGDVHVTSCVAYAGLANWGAGAVSNHGVFWEETRGDCVTSELNAWALALPFWCRLFQCLHVLRKTGEQKNFWNACKYATAFPLVYAGYLDRYEPSDYTRRLVVATAVAQSSATFAWDLFMDWGLFKKRRGALLCGLFEPGAMREPKSLVFKGLSDGAIVCLYGLLVFFNFSLRFIWTLAVFGHAPTRGLGMLNFELAEIARRTVWAVFRIEWEYHEKGWPLDGDGDDDGAALELVKHADGDDGEAV